MPDYRLSEAAKQDLTAIALYGDEHFGSAQSDRYRERLKKRFLLLAEYPERYPSVEHIRAGYRRSVCGVHSVYYRVERQGIAIMRTLSRQDADEAL